MRLLSNFGYKIIFMCSANFWHQQDSSLRADDNQTLISNQSLISSARRLKDSSSLFKGSIGHVTS